MPLSMRAWLCEPAGQGNKRKHCADEARRKAREFLELPIFPFGPTRAATRGKLVTADASREPVKPFLIAPDGEGRVRLTVRTTRLNRWNYPIVDSSVVDETFATAAEARAHAKEHFGAQPGQFATK